jgi:hypothetical protein
MAFFLEPSPETQELKKKKIYMRVAIGVWMAYSHNISILGTPHKYLK